MPRIVKQHAVRRDEILNAALGLITSRGYEQMTIQNILDELQIAKGTFYHYFGSKSDLLAAIVDRFIDAVQQLLLPVVDDTRLSATGKLNDFFSALGRFKTAQQPLFASLLRVWYADHNAVVRHKIRAAMHERITPLLASVIRQGIDEGEFAASHPDETADVVFSLSQDVVDLLARVILGWDPARDSPARVDRVVAAYTEAIERALGARPSSLVLADPQTLHASVAYLTRSLER